MGPKGSGKGKIARALVNGRSFLSIDPSDGYGGLREAALSEVVILEDVKSIDSCRLLLSDTMKIRLPYTDKPTEVKTPELIITSSFLKPSDFKEHNVNFILLTDSDLINDYYKLKHENTQNKI